MVETGPSVPSPAEIAELQLPTAVADLLREYDRQVGHRSDFLWQWLYAVFPRYRLSSVPARFHGEVREAKLVLTVYYTLLDDLADYYGDRETFEEARKLPLAGVEPDPDRAGVNADYLAVTESAWAVVEETLEAAPRVGEFRDPFAFDVQQTVTAMHYGLLANERPELVTVRGTDAYGEHNMAQFSYADVDLMYSPAFDTDDLRPLREVVWRAQRLARIANWVATWERELEVGDPTSGVVVGAVAEGVVTLEELRDPTVSADALADRVRDHGIEAAYLEEWDRLYESLLEREYDVATVDLQDYVRGMKEMRDLYLANAGRL